MTEVSTKVSMDPVTLTQGAVEAIKSIRASQDISDAYYLRIGVKGGGCSGFSYEIGFDEVQEGDSIYDIQGIKVLMHKTHALHLFGIEIDWQEGLSNRGFSFNNPNAKSTCGCGSSFST